MKCKTCKSEIIEANSINGWVCIDFSSVDEEDILLLANLIRLAYKPTQHKIHNCYDKINKQDRQNESITNR